MVNLTMTLDELKNHSTWNNAFAACAEDKPPRGVLGYAGSSLSTVSINDVREIIAVDDGENEGAHWIGAFLLNDGRFVFLSAWCDSTGFDCQGGGDTQVANSLNDLIRLAMGTKDRARLGFQLPHGVAMLTS
jgi:hypothetical protein